jgi:hypothetical protein
MRIWRAGSAVALDFEAARFERPNAAIFNAALSAAKGVAPRTFAGVTRHGPAQKRQRRRDGHLGGTRSEVGETDCRRSVQFIADAPRAYLVRRIEKIHLATGGVVDLRRECASGVTENPQILRIRESL